jgi:hypothetical protein
MRTLTDNGRDLEVVLVGMGKEVNVNVDGKGGAIGVGRDSGVVVDGVA